MPNEVGMPVLAGNSQVEIAPTKRRMISSYKNPLDKCTIVSIYPKRIAEEKCTIYPGKFIIEAGSYEEPSILVVGSSSWWQDVDIDKPMQEINVGSIQIAESVINDYANGMIGSDMAGAMPGLFFVLGEQTVGEIKLKYRKKLDEMRDKQNNWYKVLVRLADSLWARTNGNPLVICDDMRLAAKSLNFNDKPWLKDFQTAELSRCAACGSLRNPQYPICPACKSIDMSHPDSKNLKFAV